MRNKTLIPYGSQFIDKKEIKEIKKSLNNNLITTGPYVEMFENNLRKKLKSKFVISCNSGTSALHLSFLAVGLKKNDNIILPGVNFIAAANMALSMGANIFFSDIDYKTGQTNPSLIEKCIKQNKLKNIKVILNMYMGGYPRNITGYFKLKNKYRCFLIEDSCHAFGASYYYKGKNYKVGSCIHSDVSTFSFHPLKTITTGEGGAVSTNSKKIANKIKEFRSHGIFRKKSKHWIYDVRQIGFNYRLSDINCAIGCSQLKKLSMIIKKREEIFFKYFKELNGFDNMVSFIEPERKTSPSYHLILLYLDFDKLKIKKDDFFEIMRKKNIMCQFHYIPSYNFTIMKNKYKKLYGCEKYSSYVISLPIHLKLSIKEINYIISNIKNIIKRWKIN
jgi:UDP-4-amino-4,6-dideoxy-L-N-acetyl-beta-L-altrosamine transaminase